MGGTGDGGRDRPCSQGCLLALGLQPGQAFPCPTAKRVLDAEGLALGSIIATSKKARRDLIDDSFNRYWGLQSVFPSRDR